MRPCLVPAPMFLSVQLNGKQGSRRPQRRMRANLSCPRNGKRTGISVLHSCLRSTGRLARLGRAHGSLRQPGYRPARRRPARAVRHTVHACGDAGAHDCLRDPSMLRSFARPHPAPGRTSARRSTLPASFLLCTLPLGVATAWAQADATAHQDPGPLQRPRQDHLVPGLQPTHER